ncbi:MAG TPA: hypothetical protein VNB22_18465 [Pyrinomonadaceae bacterium]|nr:hypothetical protein [Pyrinomonadaceae bacterium]
MLRKSRLYFSAMLAAFLLASLLMTSNVKACDEAPLTLLSLYMNSDLIVVARYDSESEPQKANEDEYGYSLESQRKLVFSKVFKGQKDLKSVSFAYSQYVANPNQNNSEAEEESEEYEHSFDISKIKIGGEYLFFLTKNKETGEYSVTDYVSGVKETGKNLASYEKNLGELEQIASAKENQYELLTEWIVKSIEDPETREDGIGDLSESFYGLNYQEQDPEFKGKGPFVVGEEGYGTYTVGVAKHLTPAQKERVSAVLYPMLQTAWFAEKPEYVNYGISAILGGINKSRLAIYAYNSMQSVGKNDFERRRMIGEFLSDSIGDEDFSNLFYAVGELENKIDEAKTVNTPQGRKQLKDLNLLRDAKLKELDKRFKFLLGRNFVPVENKAV